MDVLKLTDGSIEIISDLEDFYDLVDRHLGLEARRWLEDRLTDSEEAWAYVDDLEKTISGTKDHYKDVLKSIRKHSENLGKLICEKDPDRREISNTVGAIGVITWKEINS